MHLAAGPPDPSHACTSIRVHGQGGGPFWVPPGPPRQLTAKVIIFAGALAESGSIAYNERQTVRFPFELDANLHQSSTDALNRDFALIHPYHDKFFNSYTYPVVFLLFVLSSVCSWAEHNIPRRRTSTLSIAPSLLKPYDITTCVLANLQYHLGVAYAVRALESKCANVVRPHTNATTAAPPPWKQPKQQHSSSTAAEAVVT